jgi:D-amino peptidase
MSVHRRLEAGSSTQSNQSYPLRCLRGMMLLAIAAMLSGAVVAAAASNPASAAPPLPNLKIYISVDMEGVAGVVTADQLLPNGFEYERFRHFMTDETLAAVRAAKQAGATQIVVSDSHGNGENLLVEAFPKDVQLVRSWPRHGAMMAGLDKSFAAAIFVGYHASTSNAKGVRAHTFSSAHLTRVALNGSPVTEAEFNAAYAGEFGVPIIFASGDDAAIAEIKARLGEMDTVITKNNLGFHSAETLTPAASCDLIFDGVLHAMAHRAQRHATLVAKPVALELSFKNYMPAEVLSYLRSVERVDSHTIRFVGRDMAEVADFVDVVERYNPDLAP